MQSLSKLFIIFSFVIGTSIETYLLVSNKDPGSRIQVKRENTEKINETWEPFNNTNSHNSWCPYATCHNSPICMPCQRRFLIIMATGRSGSTTLLSMMNKLPGVRLSGENNDEIGAQKAAVENLYEGKLRPEKDKLGAWAHYKIPDGALSCVTQKMFEIINPPSTANMMSRNFDDSHTIIGFKTIRFQLEDDVDKAIQFVKDNLPCARIIVNIRSNIEEQVLSRKNTIDSDLSDDKIVLKLQMENAKMISISEKFGEERARLIDMAEWTKGERGLQVLNDVVSWLGFSGCEFNALYHENFDRFGHENTTRAILGPECNYTNL